MIGLKRGIVVIEKHKDYWDKNAKETIDVLWSVLKGTALDIQHIGSTSIQHIHAKPIIDIVIGLKELDDITPLIPVLEKQGVIYRGSDQPNQLLFVMGNFKNDTRTHHIHVVICNGEEWNNYINFRDYLIANKDKANEYDELKLDLAKKFSDDRTAYTAGKKELINKLLNEARIWRIDA